MAAHRILVTGIVQGVGFRYSTCNEAVRLGVHGWVRNRRDGSVEILIVGEDRACDELVAWARHGPRGAKVESVELRPARADEVAALGAGFEQRDDT
jgi:acylphosphatase